MSSGLSRSIPSSNLDSFKLVKPGKKNLVYTQNDNWKLAVAEGTITACLIQYFIPNFVFGIQHPLYLLLAPNLAPL